MSTYLTKEERAAYEQRRRKLIIQESRDYRLMHGWLMKRHPDILAAHCAFKTKLQKGNPARKDLTTAPAFRKFMQEENGMEYILLFVFLRYCVTVNWLCCIFSGAVQVQRRMRVNLTDILNQPVQSQQDPVERTVVDQPTQCTAIVPVDETPTQCTVTVPVDENPFALTDEQFDELLKGLKESGDELLRGLEESGGSSGYDIDAELDSVMNMCVEDFVV